MKEMKKRLLALTAMVLFAVLASSVAFAAETAKTEETKEAEEETAAAAGSSETEAEAEGEELEDYAEHIASNLTSLTGKEFTVLDVEKSVKFSSLGDTGFWFSTTTDAGQLDGIHSKSEGGCVVHIRLHKTTGEDVCLVLGCDGKGGKIPLYLNICGLDDGTIIEDLGEYTGLVVLDGCSYRYTEKKKNDLLIGLSKIYDADGNLQNTLNLETRLKNGGTDGRTVIGQSKGADGMLASVYADTSGEKIAETGTGTVRLLVTRYDTGAVTGISFEQKNFEYQPETITISYDGIYDEVMIGNLYSFANAMEKMDVGTTEQLGKVVKLKKLSDDAFVSQTKGGDRTVTWIYVKGKDGATVIEQVTASDTKPSKGFVAYTDGTSFDLASFYKESEAEEEAENSSYCIKKFSGRFGLGALIEKKTKEDRIVKKSTVYDTESGKTLFETNTKIFLKNGKPSVKTSISKDADGNKTYSIYSVLSGKTAQETYTNLKTGDSFYLKYEYDTNNKNSIKLDSIEVIVP